ncbi:hypothetical protein SAMN04488570_0227 [Nocardioides scoriae]|uniref:Uncharacterized protein n=1 Tax=Nocardioides scoriae TaxID=642780 RepID=A0A1H1LIK0_9ACTN|nr:hypothetical protein SAMN04488570_0227 [Nocardioides scoriae]
MSLQDQLERAIATHVEAVVPPVPDIDAAVRHGRSLRRRRRAGVLAAAGTAALAVALVVPHLGALSEPPSRSPRAQSFAPVGALDYDQGLRGFADPSPDGNLSLGGRTFPIEDMGYLDTEALATSYGLVFFDGSQTPHLLGEDGVDRTLAPTPTDTRAGVRPSAKADAVQPLVALAQPSPDGVSVLLVRLDTGRTVGSREVLCSGGACRSVRVEAVDRGLVFVQTSDGTQVWDPEASGERGWTSLGGPDLRVADVRGGRILWDGTAPTPAADNPVAGWPTTRGAVDAQLTLDGGHVLSWSPNLEPTEPEGRPVRLRVDGGTWFAVDTDGSVLAAASGRASRAPVYDCEVPSGACTRIGTIDTTGGDPMFIGVDG